MARYFTRSSYAKQDTLPRTVYDIGVAFAAACAAHRVNGGYIKETLNFTDENGTIRLANKALMQHFLDGDFDLRPEDHALGEKVIQYCQSLTFKILSSHLSSFEQETLAIVEQTGISSKYHLAIVASLPAAHERAQERSRQNARVRESQGILNESIGSTVDLDVEVIVSKYSKEWDIFFVTAVTGDATVFFSFRTKLDSGTKIRIRGKVKCHKEDSTQLNYVKMT